MTRLVVDLVRLAYYPFLPEVKDAVRDFGPGMDQVLASGIYAAVRERGVARIEGALTDRRIPPAQITDDRGAMQEMLSVPIARMLCVLLADKTLIHRYAVAEGTRLEETLLQDPDSLPLIADALKLPVQADAPWRIHFSDYLQFAPSEPDWKLILRPVAKGWVPLDNAAVARLCREALDRKIQAELEAERAKPMHPDVRAALQPYVDELAPKLAEARENWQTGDFGPISKGAFPPCIIQIFQDMADGKMIAHHARFAMASFLSTIGMTVDDMIDYFREIPNFDPEKSRYQLEHIAGDRGVDKYTPPGCGTMQTHGICPLEKRDNLCFKIKHPLSYYRARQRFIKQDEEKSKHLIAAQQRKNAEAAQGAP